MNNALDSVVSHHQKSFVDSLAGRFRRQWERNRSPRVEDYLEGFSEPFRTALFQRLIEEELHHQRARGSESRPHELLLRFPEYQSILITMLGSAALTSVTPAGQMTPILSRPLGQFAQFQLLEEIGQGSGGTVYRARDTQLDRIVAIKFPHAETLSPEQRQRFLREARAIARLRHPLIVSAYSVIESEGAIGLVSNFVPGVTLEELLRTRRPDIDESLRLVSQLAHTLQAAHDEGIIHRDLKPSNFLIDIEGRPHIADFGLAKRVGFDETVTLDGQVVGTLSYMAPEQAAGRVHEHDARSDVYSLGVTFYELLTGERPFTGSLKTMLRDIQFATPRSVRELRPELSTEIAAVCHRALAKSPQDRYQTAADFAADLDRLRQGAPIVVRPEKRFTDGRSRVFTGTALFVLLLLGTLLYAFTPVIVRRARADAAAPPVQAFVASAVGPTVPLPPMIEGRPISLLNIKPEVLLFPAFSEWSHYEFLNSRGQFAIETNVRGLFAWPKCQPGEGFRWTVELDRGDPSYDSMGLLWNLRPSTAPGGEVGYESDAMTWQLEPSRRTWKVCLETFQLAGRLPGAVRMAARRVRECEEISLNRVKRRTIVMNVRFGELREVDFFGVPVRFRHEVADPASLRQSGVGLTVLGGKATVSQLVIESQL